MRTAHDSPGDKLVGQMVSRRWRVHSLLRIGTLTTAYDVRDGQGMSGVLRVLHPRFAAQPELRERFQRDPRIANKVRHRRVAGLIEVGASDDELCTLIQDKVDGDTIATWVERGPDISAGQALGLLCTALEVVHAAHGQSVLHRELRAECMLVNKSGKVVIRDFGMARIRDLAGLPASEYAAPELDAVGLRGLDQRADLYSLGVMLHALLTGAVPERGSHQSFSVQHPHAPAGLVELLDRSLAPDPADRYNGAEQMYRAARRLKRQPEIAEFGGMSSGVRELGELSSSPMASSDPSWPSIGETTDPSFPPHSATVRAAPEIPAAPGVPGVAYRDTVPAMDSASVTGLGKELTELGSLLGGWFEEPGDARFQQLWSALQELLGRCGPISMAVLPYGFNALGETIWEATGEGRALTRVWHRDGLRRLGFSPGLDPDELRTCLEVLQQAHISTEDCCVRLWLTGAERVTWEQVEAQDAPGFEALCAREHWDEEVRALVKLDTSFLLEECWSAERGVHPPDDTLRKLRGAIGTSSDEPWTAPNVDEPLREAWAQRLVDEGHELRRQAPAAISALDWQLSRGRDPGALLEALQQHVQASQQQVAVAVAYCRAALAARDARTAALVRDHLLGAKATTTLLREVLAAEQPTASLVPWVEQVLELGLPQVEVLGDLLLKHEEPTLRAALLRAFTNLAVQEPQALSGWLGGGPRGAVLPVLRVLAGLGTGAARECMAGALEHQHPLVRIEALTHVEGTESERLREETRVLLEHEDAYVRVEMIEEAAARNISGLAPALALRVRDGQFVRLPRGERAAVFQALAALLPARAEALAIQLLQDKPLLPSKAHHEVQCLAAETLGRVASTAEAVHELRDAATRRFRGSEQLRQAAEEALAAIDTRARSEGEA